MNEHTKEPWIIHKEPESVECAISKDGWFIAICCDAADYGEPNADENARRIVACVNACAGIPTDDLEASPNMGLFHLAEFANEMVIQRDELLVALKAAESALRSYQYGNAATELAKEVADKSATAIAKVK